jgi:uncharacterized membrane protein
MDAAKNPIIETLKPMSSIEARQAIATGKIYVGAIDSLNYKLAFSLIEAKEAEERTARDSENLIISRKALRNSNCATIIAIIATIISIIAIMVPLLAKK